MAIQETTIVTSTGRADHLGSNNPGDHVEVRYTDNLRDTSDIAAFNLLNDQYLFFAIYVQSGQTHYLFADTRRHEELKQLAVRDVAIESWIYGQLFFWNKTQFCTITIDHMPLSADLEIELFLFALLHLIAQTAFNEYGVNIAWDDERKYKFHPKTKRLEKIQSKKRTRF